MSRKTLNVGNVEVNKKDFHVFKQRIKIIEKIE